MHLTMADMLRTMEFDGLNWQRELHSCLQAAVWAICATVSTMSNSSPAQLVFSRDMIMQTKVVANWEAVKGFKRASTIRSNTQENKTRLPHTYKPGDKVLILLKANGENIRKVEQPTKGPHEIKEVYRNGVVKIRRGNYAENIHMRRLKPFYE